jgi:hypothetical protein
MHKNFKITLFIFIFLSAFAESSIADEWVYVAGSDDSKVYVNIQSIKRTGQKVKAWTQWGYKTPQDVAGSNPKKTFLLEKSLIVFRCDKKTVAFLSTTQYAERDSPSTIVSQVTHEDTPSLQYQNVPPDSLGEITLNYVCKAKIDKKR